MREPIATLCPFDAKARLEVTGIVERGGRRRVPVDQLDDRMLAGRSRGVAEDTQHRVFAMRRLIRDQLADLPIIILLIAFADARGSRLWRQQLRPSFFQHRSAPGISRPALEVRAAIDDLQRFFLHPLEQPSGFPLRDGEAQPKRWSIVGIVEARRVLPEELVGGLLGGETFPDQIAELIAHIAGGVVGKDRGSPRAHRFIRLGFCA